MTPTTAWIIGSIVAWVGMGVASYRLNPDKMGNGTYTNWDRIRWIVTSGLFAPIALLFLALGRVQESGWYDRPLSGSMTRPVRV